MKINITFIFALLLVLLPCCANAKNTKAHLLIEPETLQHVCWYQDKKYSEGAILQVAEILLVCSLKDKNQPNGKLGWFKLDDKGNVIYPKKPSKITVN